MVQFLVTFFSPENDFWVKKYLAYNAYKKGK